MKGLLLGCAVMSAQQALAVMQTNQSSPGVYWVVLVFEITAVIFSRVVLSIFPHPLCFYATFRGRGELFRDWNGLIGGK